MYLLLGSIIELCSTIDVDARGYNEIIFQPTPIMRLLILLAFFGLLAVSASQGQKAERCDKSNCKLPNCYCGGSEIPGGLKHKDTPQFVLLTFDDAVNGLNNKFFEDLFKNRVNPNGCGIRVHKTKKVFFCTSALNAYLFV